MHFTTKELLLIHLGLKTLTIRCFTKNGRMPVNIGTETWLKTGSYVSKERYGRIKIVDAIIKPLGEMTDEEAHLGGYETAEAYIRDQMTDFNKGVNLDTEMIFYTFEVLYTDSDLINTLK